MMFKVDAEDLGAFIGGLFTFIVYDVARDIRAQGGLSEAQWRDQKAAIMEAAFDDVVNVIAEPLKSKLRATRADFVAHALQLS